MQAAGHAVSSAMESSMCRTVLAMLRELEPSGDSATVTSRGMLRWTLSNKVENSPALCVSLVRVLVKELERAERCGYKAHIIPLVHTLAYTVLQSVHVPEDLTKRVYGCIKKLLILPEPYCTVGLHYARLISMEITTPGLHYHRRLITEHCIKNDSWALQEKVFVFADPAVFPEPLLAAAKADVEFTGLNYDTKDFKCKAVLHTLQAMLGRQCHGPNLAEALEVCGEDINGYFQEVVAITEQSAQCADPKSSNCRARMQQIYSDIMIAANKDPSSQGPLCGVPLPGPGISFHSWTQDEDIWNELANFALMISPTERSSLCADEEAEDHERKTSVTSTDSGIEGDLLASDFNGLTLDSSGVALPLEHRASMAFPRWTCVRRPKAADRIALVRESVRGSNQDHTFITEGQNLTAHVVVMGDDQTLGRLARTFHSIRKRETRHIFLTKRLKLELYYIPVISESAVTTAVEENTSTEMGKMTLARFLGNVDPWYDCTVNGLGSMVLKLAQMRRSCNDSSQSSSFLVDIISYYVRTGFQPVHIPIYSIKISFSRLSACPVEDLFVSHVQIEFKMHKTATLKYTRSICQKVLTQEIGGPVISVNYRKASLSKREKDVVMSLRTRGICISAVPPNGQKNFDSLSVRFSEIIPGTNRMDTIRTGSISIRALEKHNFTLCLDKDSRKTFKDVQRIEISQALDPGCCLHSSKSRHVLHDKEASLSKYMSKSLKLPINTFSGIIP